MACCGVMSTTMAVHNASKCYTRVLHNSTRHVVVLIYVMTTLMTSVTCGHVPTPQTPLVNGFIHLSFYPMPIIVIHGTQETGYVNVTVTDTGLDVDDVLTLHACCIDSQISKLMDESFSIDFTLDGPKWFIFNISVYGIRLGRAQIRFYVSKNLTEAERQRDEALVMSVMRIPEGRTREERGSYLYENREFPDNLTFNGDGFSAHGRILDNEYSASVKIPNDINAINGHRETGVTKTLSSRRGAIDNTEDLLQPLRSRRETDNTQVITNNSVDIPGTEWWLLGRYEVVVKRPVNWLEPWLDYVVMVFIGINMIGVGGQIDGEEVLYLVKKPAAVSVGMFCRFGVMPALGLGLVELMKPSHTVCLGVLSLLCSPHEGANSLLVLLAERDLTLSVTLMCITNFATVALLPLWTIAFEKRIYKMPGQAQIPFREIFIVFGYIIVCVMVGFNFERKCSKLYARFWSYLPAFTTFTVLLIFSVEVYKSYFIFELVTAKVFFLAAMLAVAGYLFGCAVAFIARQPLSRIIVIAIETGCRTTYITCLLLNVSLETPESDIARTTPVLGALLSLMPGFVAVLLYRGYSRYKSWSYAETECTLADTKDIIDSDNDKEGESGSSVDDCDDGEADDELTEIKETSM